MTTLETVITALRALIQNKLRTFLTMLGVIIGVFAVVSLVGLVQGIQNYVTDQFDELGSNLLFVYPGSGGLTNDPALSFSNNKLAKKHIDLLNSYAKEAFSYISPILISGKTLTYKTKSYFGTITGATSDYNQVFELDLIAGRLFTRLEERSKEKVVVLGPLVATALFKNTSPIGKSIKMDGISFEVIGVMEEKGPDFDEMVLMPYTTMETMLNVTQYSYITVKLRDTIDKNAATTDIKMALLRDLKEDEFTLFSQEDLLDTVQSILGVIGIGLGAIAAVSLFVGGIGIMNIMLVSVTERIQEIGLRKAVGATSYNIGLQFLIESITLSIAGGTFGLILGWGSTLLVRQWIRAEIPLWATLLSFGFSLFVGAVFGTYPAIKASKLDPIAALRYE